MDSFSRSSTFVEQRVVVHLRVSDHCKILDGFVRGSTAPVSVPIADGRPHGGELAGQRETQEKVRLRQRREKDKNKDNSVVEAPVNDDVDADEKETLRFIKLYRTR